MSDISSFFSPTSKQQKYIRDALKDSDSEVITTPLVLKESVSDENVSEKETDKEKTTSSLL
jgi:hypothetical protein